METYCVLLHQTKRGERPIATSHKWSSSKAYYYRLKWRNIMQIICSIATGPPHTYSYWKYRVLVNVMLVYTQKIRCIVSQGNARDSVGGGVGLLSVHTVCRCVILRFCDGGLYSWCEETVFWVIRHLGDGFGMVVYIITSPENRSSATEK